MIAGILLGILGTFLLLGLFLFLLSSSRREAFGRREDEARQAEDLVGTMVDRALSDCPERLILNSLILPGIHEERHTTEIDTLAISRKGIFVIETKSWKGLVHGSAEENPWTVLYPSGRSHELYNPVWQNRGHARHVLGLVRTRTSLSLSPAAVLPMVIFLEGDISELHAEHCYAPQEALDRIRACPVCLSLEDVEELKRLFLDIREHPPASRAEHIAYVKDIQGKAGSAKEEDL